MEETKNQNTKHNPEDGPTGSTQDNKNTTSRQHRRGKRICGAEAKRRRRARETELAEHRQTNLPSKSTGGDNSSSSKRGPERVRPTDKKRHRSGTSTEETPDKHKRPCRVAPLVSHKKSYKDAANSHLRVAIIDKENPYGKLPADKEAILKKTLLEELDNTIMSASSSSSKPPTFSSWSYSGEIIRITCDDDSSLAWLTTKVEALSGGSIGNNLEVISVDKLPRLTKATLWVPGEEKSELEGKEAVLRRLAGQNPHLSVKRWCLFHHETRVKPAKGHVLVFGVGEEDVLTLKQRSSRLSYGFTSLTIKFKTEARKEEEPTASVASRSRGADPQNVATDCNLTAVGPGDEECGAAPRGADAAEAMDDDGVLSETLLETSSNASSSSTNTLMNTTPLFEDVV